MRRLALLSLLVGCSGSAELPLPSAAVLIAPPALAGPPSPPGTLVLGASASTVTVPAAPGVTFVVERSAEYQIDLVGAAPADPHLFLFRDGSFLAADGDGGDGHDARLVRFLPPGTYEIRATEWNRRAYEASARLTILPGLPPVGETSPGGAPVVAHVPAGETDRESAAEVTLVVEADLTATIDAVATGCDAQMILIQDGSEVARDSDGGEANHARLTLPLTAGRYAVRVYDWVHRACEITVSATPST